MTLLLAAALLFAPADWKPVRATASADTRVLRDGKPSLRVEAGSSPADALIRGRNLQLTPGKRYRLEGWLRTEDLRISGGDRTTVPTALSLSMASMPWDVHTDSVAGTRNWSKVSLDFTATKSSDAPEIRIAPGASFTGKAWIEGVAVEEINTPAAWPSKVAVKSFGPAYRYPKGGWIYLHIEGKPFERGFQHGYLLAREIEGYIDRCAAQVNSKDRSQGWQQGRTVADAVFLRGFDEEILAEMKGIAEGAAAAGAKYNGRKVDIVDIVFANTITEIGLLNPAARITPTGLEGLGLTPPSYFDPKKNPAVTDRCSAFAATGKATRDGKMVIGHTTFWSLTLAEQTNVMLDIKPEKGHRVLMQAYPGGIQSGTDWYQNDAGVVLTETTIRQSPFDINGTPVAYRARKAIQYGTNVDLVVQHLKDRNNGLYTNEWLIGDAKNDEIAMFELGTKRTKLWRSSKNEWFGGTEGFYWGCNNSKDLNVRLEYVPDPQGRPTHLPYMPSARDLKWQEMYREHKGSIDENFGFLAFRTAPLVSSSAFDAKITTSEMAAKTMLWAVLGKPNEREWVPSRWQKEQYPNNEGIHSSGYRLFQAHASAPESSAAPEAAKKEAPKSALKKVPEDQLWKGWVLPATEADEWITLGSSAWHRILSADNPDESLKINVMRARESADDARTARAILQFDAIRKQMGDDAFLKMMRDFFASNTTKTVRTAGFPAPPPAVQLPDSPPLLLALMPRFSNTIIVYGTASEAGANRHAADLLQSDLNGWFETRIPILRDYELTPEIARSKSIVFIGRPEANAALRDFTASLPARFDAASFTIDGKTYAHERDGLVCTAANPGNPAEIILVLAGNSAVETVRLAAFEPAPRVWHVTRAGKMVSYGF